MEAQRLTMSMVMKGLCDLLVRPDSTESMLSLSRWILPNAVAAVHTSKKTTPVASPLDPRLKQDISLSAMDKQQKFDWIMCTS